MNSTEVFAEFAAASGRDDIAATIRFLTGSSLRGTEISVGKQDTWRSRWSEVDYKEYVRFDAFMPRPDPYPSTDFDEIANTRISCRDFSRRQLHVSVIASAFRSVLADRSRRGSPSRGYPSAGGLYSPEAYLIAARVHGVRAGVYHYHPATRAFDVLGQDDPHVLKRLRGAIGQSIGTPAAYVIFSSKLSLLLDKYGLRGLRFAMIETGAAALALNYALAASGVSALWLGGFDDEIVASIVRVSLLHELECPMLVLAIGHPTQR